MASSGRHHPAADQQVLFARPDAGKKPGPVPLAGRVPGVLHLMAESRSRSSATGVSTPMSKAVDDAVDATRTISGSADVSVMGACSGGITSSAYAAWQAGSRPLESLQSRPRCLHARPVDDRRHDARDIGDASDDRRGQEGVKGSRRPRRARLGQSFRLDAAERPDLELLGQQLSARQRRRPRSTSCSGTTIRRRCRRGFTRTFSI